MLRVNASLNIEDILCVFLYFHLFFFVCSVFQYQNVNVILLFPALKVWFCWFWLELLLLDRLAVKRLAIRCGTLLVAEPSSSPSDAK